MSPEGAVNGFTLCRCLQVEAALVASKKPYKLIPVRFVEEGGTKMGHTVIINWEAKVMRDTMECEPPRSIADFERLYACTYLPVGRCLATARLAVGAGRVLSLDRKLE